MEYMKYFWTDRYVADVDGNNAQISTKYGVILCCISLCIILWRR